MRIPILLSGLVIAACSPQTATTLPDDRLPAAAIAAFQTHAATLGDGALTCSAEAIEQAPRVSGYVNDDMAVDYAINTARLGCEASGDATHMAYFCGLYTCAFPALMSVGESWVVVPLMSGNEIEITTVYQDTRFHVRQINFGDPGGDTIVVREYGWQDGQLVRLAERSEQVAVAE
jgi:hypothetical protein